MERRSIRRLLPAGLAVFAATGAPLAAIRLGARPTPAEARSAPSVEDERRSVAHRQPVSGVALAADGRTAYTASYDGTVRLWDAATGGPRGTLPHAAPVVALSSPGRGHRLATADAAGSVSLWNVNGRKVQTTLPPIPDITDVLFSPAGDRLVTVSSDGSNSELRLWSGEGGLVRSWRVAEPVGCTAFSPDGRTLAVGTTGDAETHQVHLWDVESGRRLRSLARDRGELLSVAFAPDGQSIAIGRGRLDREQVNGEVELWEVGTGRRLWIASGHRHWIRALRFAAGGRLLASGSEDGTIRLWNRQTGACLRILAAPGPVFSLAFSWQGGELLSGGGEPAGVVALWDTESGARRWTVGKLVNALPGRVKSAPR